MIRYPRAIEPGLVRDQPVKAMDVMPTVLALCGVAPPRGVVLDGGSLLPIIQGDAASHYGVMHCYWRDGWAVREGDWKLIGVGDQPRELVNLVEPNPEWANHAADRPALVDRLHTLHTDWLERVTPER